MPFRRHLQAKQKIMKNFAQFIIVLIIISNIALAQNNVFLRWKINPGDTIRYRTVIQETDTATAKRSSISLSDPFAKNSSKSKEQNEASRIYSELRKATDNSNLLTTITENKKGNLDIVVTLSQVASAPKNRPDTTDLKTAEILKTLKKLTGSVALRGEISKDGKIESFYVKNDQKNLLAILFELPGKELTIGQTWSLSTNLISMDQNFVCDSSSKKNIVTLIAVKDSANDKIATLKYDIVEFASGKFSSPMLNSDKNTSLHISVRATAEFSLTKGRWISFQGLMSLFSSGVMTSESVKRLELTPF